MTGVKHWGLPCGIEVYDIGARRLYVKTGVRSIAISESDLTPQELAGIAGDIATRLAQRTEPRMPTAEAGGEGRDRGQGRAPG